MYRKTTLIVILFCMLCPYKIFSQKKIEKSKQELTEKSAVKQENNSTSSKNNSSSSNNETSGGLVLGIFIDATFAVFKYGIIGDYKNEEHLFNNVSRYPYYDGNYGNFNSDDTLSKSKIRIDIEDVFIYSNKNLMGNHFKAKIRPFQYFYFQTDFRQIYEFDFTNDTKYQLYLSHYTIGYDRIRMDKFNLGWNLGISYIGNEVRKTAFSYGVSTDFFLDKNISFFGSAKWSKINSNPVNAFELQSRFHKKNYFIILGFEHLKIATPTYNFVTLGAGVYF
ncbi:conserved hypothetical protein [Flavobacterium sp. 9AF]|uniref:hypothetical protein n=1 Tax=Flavobacterium sp. 9AF TaxID=2653142 RepID=UPI0012EF5E9D|nr:hypothetical protein [Flavobacterium sp. 9AF]VXB78025.1 conserved hypothetical protein [Flavobacterium sp. 9AF]